MPDPDDALAAADPEPANAGSLSGGWVPIICGGIIAGLGFGIGTSFGLFVAPITSALDELDDGLCNDSFGREVISLAVGISMFVNGAASVVWGSFNDHFGIFPTIVTGACMIFCFLWLTSFAETFAPQSATVLYFSIPLTGFSDAALSPGIVLNAVGQLFTDEKARARAMGTTSAIQSCGAVFVPPLIALVISAVDKWYTAFRVVGCVALLMIPLVFVLRPGKDAAEEGGAEAAGSSPASATLRDTVAASWRNGSFVLLVAGFFACGFHVVFITTHVSAHQRPPCLLPPSDPTSLPTARRALQGPGPSRVGRRLCDVPYRRGKHLWLVRRWLDGRQIQPAQALFTGSALLCARSAFFRDVAAPDLV